MTDLVEKVARAIAARNGQDPDKMIYESLDAANANRQIALWKTYTSHAKAAIDTLAKLGTIRIVGD